MLPYGYDRHQPTNPARICPARHFDHRHDYCWHDWISHSRPFSRTHRRLSHLDRPTSLFSFFDSALCAPLTHAPEELIYCDFDALAAQFGHLVRGHSEHPPHHRWHNVFPTFGSAHRNNYGHRRHSWADSSYSHASHLLSSTYPFTRTEALEIGA